jgi:hypothetical protein
MAADLTVVPEAADDIASAYAWYESQRYGLGEDFLSVVDAAFERIRRQPNVHFPVHGDYRRALLRRFPY